MDGNGTTVQTVALVTGATSGIGRAVARHLASRGYRVYGTGRDVPPGEGAGVEGGVRMVPLDVNCGRSVEAAVASILEAEGRIDLLVNNAGWGLAGAIEETSVEEGKAQLETLFFGVHRLCRAVLPAMRRAGGGTIINISSLAGQVAVPFQGFYSAAKFALEGYSEALRMEVRPFHIRVALVEPGDLKTGFTGRRQVAEAARRAESPYREQFARTLAVMVSDEQGGAPPDAVGRLVERIAGARGPRLRYRFARPSQGISVFLKKILPQRIFEAGVMKYYRLR